MPPLDPRHQSEFGTLASWTADELTHLDPASLIAGACRGSASPTALAWLAECLGLHAGQRLLDVGSGLGGPAAWAAAHYAAVPTAVDPMIDAAHGGRRLFGLETAVASGDQLPFRQSSFDAAWMLGVLDTLPHPRLVLDEVHRVLTATGRLGLLAYTLQEELPETGLPSGNSFQTSEQLLDDLRATGFAVIDRIDASALPPAPVDWQVRQDRLTGRVAEAHGDDPRHQDAADQSDRFGALLEAGVVTPTLLHLVCL